METTPEAEFRRAERGDAVLGAVLGRTLDGATLRLGLILAGLAAIAATLAVPAD